MDLELNLSLWAKYGIFGDNEVFDNNVVISSLVCVGMYISADVTSYRRTNSVWHQQLPKYSQFDKHYVQLGVSSNFKQCLGD